MLGRWLRSKKIIITLNDHLIVHAGISQRLVDMNLGAQEINHCFRDSILPGLGTDFTRSPVMELLESNDGPVWYRGLADTLSFSSDSLQRILDYYNAATMIVGHSIVPQITPAYGGKLLLVDCGLYTGNTGQILIYKNEAFYAGSPDGKKSLLTAKVRAKKQMLFDVMHNIAQKGSRPRLVIQTEFKNVIKSKLKKEEHQAIFSLYRGDSLLLSLNPTVRSRGNMRKQVCHYPPVKFNFTKKELSGNHLSSADKLKLVMPCRDGSDHQEKLLKEYFLYTLYQVLDSQAFRAHLAEISFVNAKMDTTHSFTTIVVEDEETYAIRQNARILDQKGVINSTALDRRHFLIMYFFQYMIANTDWSVGNRHNLLLAKLPEHERIIAIPYDFDYSGFVGQNYAVPDASLPIKSVYQRYFMPYVISHDEFDFAVKYFQDKKEEVMLLCEKASYFDETTREKIKSFFNDFFKEIEKPETLRKYIKTQ